MLLAPAAARLRTTHPGLTVELSEQEVDECIGLLLADRLDIGIVVPTPEGPETDDPRFDQTPLVTEPLDLLVAAGHPLATRERVGLVDARHESWIVARDRPDQNHLLMAACGAAGFTPRIEHHATSWLAATALVANGLGVCLIPRLLETFPNVARIRLADQPPPSRQVIALTRRGSARQVAGPGRWRSSSQSAARMDLSCGRRPERGANT
jgi:DNA-binding transcriptional LysR family regulator